MKKSTLGLGLLLSFVSSQAFAATLNFTISETSKISKGGIKRVDGLVSSKDIEDNAGRQADLSKTAPFVAGLNKYVILSSYGYELRHINDNGREKFELTINTVGDEKALVAGFAYSAAVVEGTTSLKDTPKIVITSTNYSYIKDLVALVSRSDAALTCLVEKGQVVTLLTGEDAREILKIEKISCH